MFDISEIFTHVRGVIGASFTTIKTGGWRLTFFSISKKLSFWAKKRKREEIFKIFFGISESALETNLHTKFHSNTTYSLGDLSCDGQTDRQTDRQTTVKHNTHPLRGRIKTIKKNLKLIEKKNYRKKII